MYNQKGNAIECLDQLDTRVSGVSSMKYWLLALLVTAGVLLVGWFGGLILPSILNNALALVGVFVVALLNREDLQARWGSRLRCPDSRRRRAVVRALGPGCVHCRGRPRLDVRHPAVSHPVLAPRRVSRLDRFAKDRILLVGIRSASFCMLRFFYEISRNLEES